MEDMAAKILKALEVHGPMPCWDLSDKVRGDIRERLRCLDELVRTGKVEIIRNRFVLYKIAGQQVKPEQVTVGSSSPVIIRKRMKLKLRKQQIEGED